MASTRGLLAEAGKLRPLLTEVEVAERLGVNRRTVQGWRYRGSGGPPWLKLGTGRSARIRYEPGDVDDYLAAARRKPADTE